MNRFRRRDRKQWEPKVLIINDDGNCHDLGAYWLDQHEPKTEPRERFVSRGDRIAVEVMNRWSEDIRKHML